jgi:hypothetical protein
MLVDSNLERKSEPVREEWKLRMPSVPPSEYSELDQTRPLILLLGNVDHGFGSRMPKGRDRRYYVAQAAAFVCLAPGESRRGYSDSPAIVRTFDCRYNHALYAHKS